MKKKIELQFSKLQCHSDTMFINTECGGVVRAINSIFFSWSFFFLFVCLFPKEAESVSFLENLISILNRLEL